MNNRPTLLKQRKNNNKQLNNDNHWITGSWLGQAHKVCGGVKPVSEHLTLPLTWDSGVT